MAYINHFSKLGSTRIIDVDTNSVNFTHALCDLRKLRADSDVQTKSNIPYFHPKSGHEKAAH